MKKFYLFLIICLSCLACNKIDISEDDPNKNPPVKPDTPAPPADSTEIDLLNPINVATALSLNAEGACMVHGFIVGYVKGMNIKGATFGLPEETENTNMLLADTPNETDYTHCMPIKLEKTGKYATRDSLNLMHHPQYLKKYIEISGFLSKYFRVNGITTVYSYELSEFEGDIEDNGSDEEIETPGYDDNETLIPEGRSIKTKVF